MLNNPNHKFGRERVRKAEDFYVKYTFQEIVFIFLRRTPKCLALASVKLGEQFPNRADICRTWAEVRRIWAEVRRIWAEARRIRAGNF